MTTGWWGNPSRLDTVPDRSDFNRFGHVWNLEVIPDEIWVDLNPETYHTSTYILMYVTDPSDTYEYEYLSVTDKIRSILGRTVRVLFV